VEAPQPSALAIERGGLSGPPDLRCLGGARFSPARLLVEAQPEVLHDGLEDDVVVAALGHLQPGLGAERLEVLVACGWV